jgi:hypothetical protein
MSPSLSKANIESEKKVREKRLTAARAQTSDSPSAPWTARESSYPISLVTI